MNSSRNELRVRVNDDLALDAGWWEERSFDDGSVGRLVHPPETTLFEQVLAYLKSLPKERYQGIRIGQEAVAATAVCLRWGSYLAVLMDRDKPLMPQAGREGVSRISNSEMARINIEASAALEQWVEIMRRDYRYYLSLMWAAQHLPMPQKSVRRDPEYTMLLALSQSSEIAAVLQPHVEDSPTSEVKAHPTRVLTNALINTCWRNGPVEDIHSGWEAGYPLTQRRITPSEGRTLMRTTAGRLAQGLHGYSSPDLESVTDGQWIERVLPYHIMPFVKPTGWSLTEKTCQVRLPGGED